MNRAAWAITVMLLGVCVAGVAVHACGIDLGLEAYTLDLTGTWSQVPVAASAAFDALEAMLSDQGIPPAELAGISAEFEHAVNDLAAIVAGFPTLVPVPLVALGMEIPLSWVVIDGARVSVGFLDDRLVRGAATGLAGIPIPDPLFETTIEIGEHTASVAADLSFSTWKISIDAVKLVDLGVLGVDAVVGVDVLWGAIVPAVDIDVPEAWDGGVQAALAAAHLDEFSWSALGLHAGIAFELGLPFLRLYAEARFVLPISLNVGWWDLRAGNLTGGLGMVIRF